MKEGIRILGRLVLAVLVIVMFIGSFLYMADKVSGTDMEKWFYAFLWFINGLFVGMGIMSRRSPFCILG